MNLFAIIDQVQRNLNSVGFRCIIVIYSIFVITLYDNLFSQYIYWVTIPLYLTIYFFLSRRHILRLLNDFLFIVVVIFGKNPNEPFLFVYLILPIINSINFSGAKRSWLLYFITIITYYLLLSLYYGKLDTQIFTQNYLPIISILLLILIESYTATRVKFRDFTEQLNAVVDSFYTKKKYHNKPHRLYPELIELINTEIEKDLVENIYCFTTSLSANNKLVIVNSSNFIWSFKLDEKKLLDNLEKQDYLLNIDLEIDNKNFHYNCVLKTKIEGTTYFYIVTAKRPIPFYYQLIGVMKVLKPVFSKISTVLVSEKYLQEMNINKFEELREQREYVVRANKTMHFIRNRLGPIKNLIEMLEKYQSFNESDINKKALEATIFEEISRAKNDYKNIIERADYLLEKSHNPFNFTTTKTTNIKKLFSLFAEQVGRFFPDANISREVIADEFNSEYHIKINKDGFHLLLSDWLCNMHKYCKSSVRFFFTVQDNIVKVEFWNDYKNSKDDINALITNMTSPNRNEIMKRETYGLSQIKSCLEDMNIKYQISVISEDSIKFLRFELFFNLIKDEDSNI